jgi:hypothetical protein
MKERNGVLAETEEQDVGKPSKFTQCIPKS